MLYRNSLNCKLQKFSTKALLQSSKDINSGSLPILLLHFISSTNLYIYIWRILKSFPLKKGSFIYKICIIHFWFTFHGESLFLTFAHLRRQTALYPVPSCLSLMYLFVRVAKSCRSITINWKPIVETRSSTQQKSGRNKISRLVNLAKLVKRRSIDSETMIEYAHSAMAQSNFPLWWRTFCSISSSVLFPCPFVVRAGAIVDAAKHQIFSNRWKRIFQFAHCSFVARTSFPACNDYIHVSSSITRNLRPNSRVSHLTILAWRCVYYRIRRWLMPLKWLSSINFSWIRLLLTIRNFDRNILKRL